MANTVLILTEKRLTIHDLPINARPDLDWQQGHLQIEDMISGGTAREVRVEFATEENWIFLRTTGQVLQKYEYEKLFGLNGSEQPPGKTIRLCRDNVMVIYESSM